MRKLLFFAAVFSASISFGRSENLDEVRSCITEIHSNQNPLKYQEIVNHCYDMALPWSTSASLQGRSLYIQVLQSYLNSGSDRASMQSMSEKLADYYLKHLDAEITPTAIDNWSDLDIQTVFDGLSSVEFYTSKIFETDIAIKQYTDVFESLEKRNLATAAQAHYLYKALLSNGRWTEARNVLKRWPNLSMSPLPIIVSTAPPLPLKFGYYEVSQDLTTMVPKDFDGNHGPRIILSGSCHFAIDLVRDLSKESEIANLMEQYGIAINPNDFSDFDFQKMKDLKAEFPEFEFHPVSSSGSWFVHGIHTLSSPTVLFLLDGHPKYEMSGVTKYDVADFCRGIKSIGLSASKSCVN